MPMINVMNIG